MAFSSLRTLLNMLAGADIGGNDIDLCREQPGYEDFSTASDAEYEEHNFKKALKHYKYAVEKKHPMACCNLALWYLQGHRPGVGKDPKEAFRLFEMSAEKKIGLALFNLAHFYYTGKAGIVKKNVDKAFRLVREAVKDERLEKMRNSEPYMMLSVMYSQGEGCLKNVSKSLKYCDKAIELGDRNAVGMRKLLSMLVQIDPMQKQRDTDDRWAKMCAYEKSHADHKCVTLGDHEALLDKFGFDLETPLTAKQRKRKGGFDVFMNVTGGTFSLRPDFEIADEDFVPNPKTCDFCKKPGATKRCSKCGERYCNRECQVKGWKDHKRVCNAVQDALE